MATTINAGRVRFVSRGTYNNSTQYYLFDLVNYNGSSYIAKENSLGNLPTNTQYWQLIAEKGNTGNTGQTGPVGPTGNGIASIRKTGTSGLVDTYTITYTNGNTTTFTVTNGEDANTTEITNLKNENVYLQNVVKQAFTEKTASGTELTIDNTIEARMEMKLNGNTSQNGEPTPATPQEIHCVKGNNVVKVTNQNLFDESVKTGNTLTSKYNIISDSNGVLEIQGVENYYSGIFKTYKLKAKTQYTISLQCDFVGENSVARVQYKIGNESEKISWSYADNGFNVKPINSIKSMSFTTDSTGQVSIMFVCNETTNKGYVKYSHIQLEQNDTATNFVLPHSVDYPINLGDFELNSIGTYKDYFKKENGKWYKVEKIKSIIADGTNYLCEYMFPNGTFFIYSNAEKNTLRDAFKISGLSLFSNYLISKTYTAVFSNGEVGACYNVSTGEVGVNIGISSNNEDINTWLSTHNLIIKYVLQTPDLIEITDTTLINQLNEISQALSQKGTTIISQNNDDLPFNLDVIALTK